MSNLTQFLSRLLGLYCIIVAVAMAMHKETTLETITALVHDQPLMFIVGVITLFAGLAMVLAHNTWRTFWVLIPCQYPRVSQPVALVVTSTWSRAFQGLF